jgi:hypothetical protein
MNIEEKKEKLLFLQKFFVKSFVVSFIILILASVLCIAMHDAQVAIVNKYFPLDDIKDLNYLILLTFGIWKVLIIQFTLVPALVISCMRHCCKCNSECETKAE